MPFENDRGDNKEYNAKHITVDLGGQKTAKAGANFSVRQVFDIVDDTGKKTRGFFTPDESADENEIFESRSADIEIPKNRPELDLIRQETVNYEESYRALLQKMFTAVKKGNASAKISQSIVAKDYFDLANFSSESLDELGVCLKKELKLPKNTFNRLSEDPDAITYVTKIMKTVSSAQSRAQHAVSSAHQSHESNLNRRNNAMYYVAELLGAEHLIARSVPMTVKNGDKTINGSFMVNASGVSSKDLKQVYPGNEGKRIEITGSYLRDVSMLQGIDTLCANVDRHAGNMFYKTDNSTDTIKLTGVQGIDNDDSFGKFTAKDINHSGFENRMSLIKDIKVMDAAMAQRILALTPEKFEAKIRLAGLSEHEISAANERLALMQKRIRDGKIELLSNISDWDKYTAPEKLDTLVTVEIETTDSKGRPLKEPNIKGNIFKLACDRVKRFYETPNEKDIDPKTAKARSPVVGDVPTAKILDLREEYTLQDHISKVEEYLKETMGSPENYLPEDCKKLKEQFRKTTELLKKRDKEFRTSPEYAADTAKIETKSKTYELTFKMMPDKLRNEITESLNELSKAAGRYVKAHGKDDTGNAYIGNSVHESKNLIAYIDFARDSIQRDAMEAEMRTAKTLAEQIKRENGVADVFVPTDRLPEHKVKKGKSYEALKADIKAIEGRSTDYYKNMIKAFNEAGDPAVTGKNSMEKQLLYNRMKSEAVKYLRHKLSKYPNAKPEELKNKFTEKEMKRIRFARDVVRFSDNGLAEVKKQIRADADKAREKEDYNSIAWFRDRCADLAENYKNADPDKKADCAKKILDARKMFAEGYKKVTEISSRYPEGHDMKAACGVMLADGNVKEFMKAYYECASAVNPVQNTNVYEMLGITEECRENGEKLEEYGKTVIEKLKNPEANVNAGNVPEAEKYAENGELTINGQ